MKVPPRAVVALLLILVMVGGGLPAVVAGPTDEPGVVEYATQKGPSGRWSRTPAGDVPVGQPVRFDGMFHPAGSNLTMAEARSSRINAFGIQYEGKTYTVRQADLTPRDIAALRKETGFPGWLGLVEAAGSGFDLDVLAAFLWLARRVKGEFVPYETVLDEMSYDAAPDRYDGRMPYRRTGRSGLQLPAISLGLWNNFGDDRPLETSRAVLRRAFDLGITHFDLANNYGPPYGTAETNFGRIFHEDFVPYRDELVLSTKAGYDMWPGPYGEWGSRKYLLASLDQSLARMRVDYVDIFYSHRFDPETPLEETLGALHTAVQQGKALYAGISSYGPESTRAAAALMRELGTPLLIHQPSYSLLNRWIEPELLDVLGEGGIGCIAFSPLAQGVLTDRYLGGIPEGSRASRNLSLPPDQLTEQTLGKVRALDSIAQRRGQSLAQLAIAWVLRDPRVTSALIGASSVAQLEANVAALERLDFDEEELAEIDRHATDADLNLWDTNEA